MEKLSPLLSFYRPSTAVDNPAAPKLILLLSWMDARDAHIAKYVSQYQALYPTASILLVKSTLKSVLITRIARKGVVPAAHIVHDLVSQTSDKRGDKKPEMLLHVFSNGGSCTLYHLYDAYAATTKAAPGAGTDPDNSKILPPHVTIFDSAPGRWTYRSSVRALTLSVPPGWMRLLAWPLIRLHLAAQWLSYRLFKAAETMHVWGLSHNDQSKARETCRSYAYSESDDMVLYQGVEEHADDAEAKGFRVLRREKFPGSLHVAHARSDPEKYWRLVRETWESR